MPAANEQGLAMWRHLKNVVPRNYCRSELLMLKIATKAHIKSQARTVADVANPTGAGSLANFSGLI